MRIYNFFTIKATKQYRIGITKISPIKVGVNGTNPKNSPIKVNGMHTATAHNTKVNKYTVLDAWLSKNGILAVLIIWSPIKLDTIP